MGLLLLAVVAFGFFYIRGTWADDEVHFPKKVSDGPVSQIFRRDAEHKDNVCAVVLPYPPEKVWAVVTDYSHYSDFLPYIKNVEAVKKDDLWNMKGQAEIPLAGDLPFEINIHESKRDLSSGWSASWDEKPTTGQIEINRGSWMLFDNGPNETLLVVTLEAQVRPTPTFLLRNYFLHRLKMVVKAVEKRLKDQADAH